MTTKGVMFSGQFLFLNIFLSHLPQKLLQTYALWKVALLSNIGIIAVIFPPQNTDFKAVPLKAGEDEDYMLALKQEMRGTMQRLPHHIKHLSNKSGEEHSAFETWHLMEFLWQDK